MKNEITLKNSAGGGINRDSNIELLKIIAIFLIVISHVVQTLGTDYGFGTYNDYLIVLGNSTTDITTIILNLMRYFGCIGNDIFFICTAWFMIDRKPRAKKQILTLITEVWTISLIMLIFVICFGKGNIGDDKFGIFRSFFPVTFGNNWYITCYILFCLVHPYLNLIIRNSDQRRLFRIVVVMSALYIIANYFMSSLFFASRIIVWIAIYFLIAYCKKYTSFINNIKINIFMVLFGLFGNAATVLMTNYLGFRLEAFSDKLLYWHQISNPFLLMIALGLFNLFRQCRLKSRAVNYISSLSLYIYLFHENPLFARYCRSALWHEIYIRFGHDHVLIWVVIYSTALLIAAAIVSAVYQNTLHILVLKILDKAYPAIKKLYSKAENFAIQI